MYKYLAHDPINNEFEEFDTIEQAREWLEDIFLDPDEGYHPNLMDCKIYKLVETVNYEVIDSKDNYKYLFNEDIPEDDEESEACPFGGADYDEIWKHRFESVKED